MLKKIIQIIKLYTGVPSHQQSAKLIVPGCMLSLQRLLLINHNLAVLAAIFARIYLYSAAITTYAVYYFEQNYSIVV